MRMINVAQDFTKFPGGRYKSKGKGSGEEFRDKFLLPSLKNKEALVVDLDGTEGYPPSFLEEAFGGLVRLGFSEDAIWQFIKLRASPNYEVYSSMARHYVREACDRQ